ncbi:MAG: glycosyltransferase, partial [Pirellulales bacterium]
MALPVDVLFEYPALNGGERSWLALLAGLRDAGFQPRAIVPAFVGAPHALAAELLHRDVSIRQLAYCEASGVRRPLASLRADLAGLLRDDRPALLHANSLATSRLSGPVCRELGIPSLGHLRDIIKLSAQAVADTSAHTRLLAVSRATRDHHVSQGFSAEKIHLCYNGVELARFRPLGDRPNRLRPMYEADARLLISVGQISLRKGLDTIAAACQQQFVIDDSLHWLVVGERHSDKPETVEFDQRLRDAAARPPLAGRVHFLGRRDDIEQLLPQCDLLVHAARQEPLGRVLLEAAACGLAVAATDVGGAREIFCRDSATSPAARLVPPNDAATLAEAIAAVFANSEQTQALANEARAICRDRFDVAQA